MDKKIYSIPFDDPFNIPDDITADFASAKFSDNFDENLMTTFIYLRNIEYSGSLVFSGMPYVQRSAVMRQYMLRDIRELKIKELDAVLFGLFLGDPGRVSGFFTDDEAETFVSENFDILSELNSFIRSLPLFVMSLDKSGTFNFDPAAFEHKPDIPRIYECACQMICQPECDAMMFQPPECSRFEYNPAFFDAVFKYDNGYLADLVQGSAFMSMYSNIVDLVIKSNAEAG